MIALQGTQVELLTAIREGMEPMATKKEIVEYLNQQMGLLRKYSEESKVITEQFQTAMTRISTEAVTQINTAVKETEIRVGSMKGIFSDRLSTEQETMKTYTKKLFRISMIPAGILLLLELTPRIWSLISQMF